MLECHLLPVKNKIKYRIKLKNFLNFHAVHLVAEIILEHSFLSHFMGGFSIFGLQKELRSFSEKKLCFMGTHKQQKCFY